MKEEHKEVRARPTYSQSDLLDFYKQYSSKKRKTAESAEQTTVDAPLVGKSEAYAKCLAELQVATEDLIELKQKFRDTKARVEFLEEELMKLGGELQDESIDNFQAPENEDDSKLLGSEKFLKNDKKYSDEFNTTFSIK